MRIPKSNKVGDKKSVWWSSTAIEMVLKLYEKDFERFGYSNSTSSLQVVSSMFKIKKFEAIYTSKLIKKKLMRKLR